MYSLERQRVGTRAAGWSKEETGISLLAFLTLDKRPHREDWDIASIQDVEGSQPSKSDVSPGSRYFG